MSKFLSFTILFILSGSLLNAQSWQSELVSMDANGDISYTPDEDGYIIPDFSHAGYMGGGVKLPQLPVVKEISPISGDNTKHIQDAINEISLTEKDENGFRGALLLKAGKYDVYGTIYMKYDGIVLRGEGQGEDTLTSTIICARGNSPYQRDVILMGSTSSISGSSKKTGTESMITSDLVPVGSRSFNVENSTLYEVGDRIIIYHPASAKWIAAVDSGGVPYPDPYAPNEPDERWVEGQLPILYNRYITAINGNQLSVDAPVFYSLDKAISESYVYKPNMNGLVFQLGLEHLRIDIETAGGNDEAHAWQAVRFKSTENSWAQYCTFTHFGQSGIITEACTRSTFFACSAIDPVAIITGERMYNFNTYHYSQLNLFSHCYARAGRHHYVSNGTSTTSGNVFLKSVSDATNSVNEGHRQWTQGMLYDNHTEINLKRVFVLGFYNRVAKGTGHGWATVHSVFWNCDADQGYGEIGLQKPPTAQNYAIGCFSKTITGKPISESDFPLGYVEGHNTTGLEPASLYEAQLRDRLNIPVHVSENTLPELELFPTLVDNELRVRLRDNTVEKLFRIRNSNGIVVLEALSNESLSIFYTSHLPPGIYLLECESENAIQSSKFIKY